MSCVPKVRYKRVRNKPTKSSLFFFLNPLR